MSAPCAVQQAARFLVHSWLEAPIFEHVSFQGHLRPTEIVVYEGFSTGFELISGNLGVPTTPPPRLQV